MRNNIQKFDVGLKAFIESKGKVLVVRESNGGLWEVPGGRIDSGEENQNLDDILQREIREELGTEFTAAIHQPFITWIRTWTPPKVGFVYLTGFRSEYISGDVKLSDEHTEYAWIDQSNLQNYSFAPGYREALDEFFKVR